MSCVESDKPTASRHVIVIDEWEGGPGRAILFYADHCGLRGEVRACDADLHTAKWRRLREDSMFRLHFHYPLASCQDVRFDAPKRGPVYITIVPGSKIIPNGGGRRLPMKPYGADNKIVRGAYQIRLSGASHSQLESVLGDALVYFHDNIVCHKPDGKVRIYVDD